MADKDKSLSKGRSSTLYKRYVQVGRVVRILRGADKDKLAVIIEIIDPSRVLIHGPTTGVKRKPISLHYVDVTRFKVRIGRSPHAKVLTRKLLKDNFASKYAQTTVAKKIVAAKKKASLNDFENFKARIHRRQKKHIIETAIGEVKKAAKDATSVGNKA